MERDPSKHLFDMLERARRIEEWCDGESMERLDHDLMFRAAIEREFMIVGEALFRLREYAPDIAEQITHWQAIIGFRHKLVHGYDAIKTKVVWQIIRDDLPLLIKQLEGLMPDPDHEE